MTGLIGFSSGYYAMENADEHARKAARYSAPSHQEGGVYKIIEAYLEGELDLG